MHVWHQLLCIVVVLGFQALFHLCPLRPHYGKMEPGSCHYKALHIVARCNEHDGAQTLSIVFS